MNTHQSAGRAAARPIIVSWLLVAVIPLLVGCPSALSDPAAVATLTPIAATVPRADGLTADEAATLGSLTRVDDYPLYTMHYHSAIRSNGLGLSWQPQATTTTNAAWACALFAALGDAEGRLFGRNFDWRFSPALLLFTEPPPSGGYASVSMVDLEYFGLSDRSTGTLVDPLKLSLAERRSLLRTPAMPFDGMNAAGVAVGMAAVPYADERHDPGKQTIGSLAVIREILDHAGNVEESVAILKRYNIDWEGGPPLHYLVADRSGSAALVEFHGGEIVVMPAAASWHAATNFTRSEVENAAGQCPRYDALVRRLSATNGALAPADALDLLQAVAQSGTATQWSVVYNMNKGQVDIVMGRRYARVHTFQLDFAARR